VPALGAQDKLRGDAVAYEVVSSTDNLKFRSAPTNCLTRSQLLRAILTFSNEVLLYFESPLARAYVHAETGLEQAVVCHTFARMATCYTCTALDASDESLKHRFLEFAPAFIVASRDGSSGSFQETAARRCIRLFNEVPCHEIFRGAAQIWSSQTFDYAPPMAVGDSHVLMVVFTSGSTGKPKGVVHGHGGYGSCVSRSMSYVFNARPGADIFLTLATFAWITGQSYMLFGPALARCASLLIEGSPLGADGLRWAQVAKVRGATILKCASAFARQIMADHFRREALEFLDLPNSSLRLGTFCAEPVSAEVQQWASRHLVAPFLNSYWATEHGSIIMSRHPLGRYQPDTKCWPVPWVKASLLEEPNVHTDALGDFLLDAPYAGLVRTVFGNLGDYGESSWCGDLVRFKAAYFPDKTLNKTFGFFQGDAARFANCAFTFHGRRDEVINVLGVRVGLEELEKVAWLASHSEVVDLAIVGAPDNLKGQAPVGWVVLSEAKRVGQGLLSKWRQALRENVGSYAEPSTIIAVSALPKTATGKIQRRLLQAALQGGTPVHPCVAANAVSDMHAYADCYSAAQHWRLCEASAITAPLEELPVLWKQLCFDGHDVGGSPLIPATGWLCLLSNALSVAPIGLHKIHLIRGVRNPKIELVFRKHTRNTASIEGRCGESVLKCEFGKASLVNLATLDVQAWPHGASAELLEDIGYEKHYQRCAAVALRYSGPFKCIERVVWRADWSFRASIVAATAPALLDAALQIVCSMDALSRGITFIPFYIEQFQAVNDLEQYSLEPCYLVGKLKKRDDLHLECNFAFYASSPSSTTIFSVMHPTTLIATLEGVKFAKVDDVRPTASTVLTSEAAHTQSSANAHEPTKEGDTSLFLNIISLGSDLIGSKLDPNKSLFENGLHSLRAVEFIGKLNQAYGVNLSAVQLVPGEDTFTTIAAALRSAIDAYDITGSSPRFAHVDHEALQRIVDARLTGVEASDLRAENRRPAIAEAARGVIYMIRRGVFKYLRIQYCDGLFRFLLSIPTYIDLDRAVVVPGSQVTFEQTDYNRHFTVREIIRDSERGFYNLIHASGLAHLEHYYRVMFFASRLEARFDAELVEGETYEMRGKITNITGPLVDAEVSFYSLRTPDIQAFVVTWRLMLVIDPERKLMYDFERGGTFSDSDGKFPTQGDLPFIPALPGRSQTWTLTRRGKFITSGSIAFFGVLVGLYAMAPVAFRMVIPLPRVLAHVLKDLKPREAIIIFAMLGLWLRTHPGQEPLDGPVDMLLPHG